MNILHNLCVFMERFLIVVWCRRVGAFRTNVFFFKICIFVYEWRSSHVDQPRPCHSSSIWPVSPRGKRCFRELLCFPFTEKIRIKMNQGIFFCVCGRSELEEKGKRFWLFKVRKKGLHVRETEIMRVGAFGLCSLYINCFCFGRRVFLWTSLTQFMSP